MLEWTLGAAPLWLTPVLFYYYCFKEYLATVVQDELDLVNLLPPPLECWDHRFAL